MNARLKRHRFWYTCVWKLRASDAMPVTELVAYSSTDVSSNHSFWPEFGEYDELIRVERINSGPN